MANLIAQTPLRGAAPVTIGQVTLTEVMLEQATSVAAFKGKATAVSAALKAAIGIGLPGPNRSLSKGDARAIWVGANRALILGSAIGNLDGLAAVVDQADGLACVLIDGAGAEDVLARLVPLDLRIETFKKGHTARTFVNHLTASVTRVGVNSFEIMVMRSMAQTLWHELTDAATGVAAR